MEVNKIEFAYKPEKKSTFNTNTGTEDSYLFETATDHKRLNRILQKVEVEKS